MPARAALNAYYAWRVRGLDAKQRKAFDDDLYGWTAETDSANRALMGDSGGEG